jgi:hypothetical protein
MMPYIFVYLQLSVSIYNTIYIILHLIKITYNKYIVSNGASSVYALRDRVFDSMTSTASRTSPTT